MDLKEKLKNDIMEELTISVFPDGTYELNLDEVVNHLINQGWTKTEFKIDDAAYYVDEYHRRISRLMVISIEITHSGIAYGCKGGDCTTISFDDTEIGKTIFKSEKDALKFLFDNPNKNSRRIKHV